MRKAVRLLICVVLSLMVVGGVIPALATTFDTIDFIPLFTGNNTPWYGTPLRYQLWFSQGMMTGYTGYIDGITQFVLGPGTEAGSFYADIYASTTAVGSGALSSLLPDDNRGPNNTLIFSGPLEVTSGATTLVIDTNPVFNYDGSANLLLDFIVSSTTGVYVVNSFQCVGDNGSLFHVLIHDDPGPYVESFGSLRTQIDFNPVPVPPTSLLVGSGLLGLAGWRRFRKS